MYFTLVAAPLRPDASRIPCSGRTSDLHLERLPIQHYRKWSRYVRRSAGAELRISPGVERV
jgi:hypothetical protein